MFYGVSPFFLAASPGDGVRKRMVRMIYAVPSERENRSDYSSLGLLCVAPTSDVPPPRRAGRAHLQQSLHHSLNSEGQGNHRGIVGVIGHSHFGLGPRGRGPSRRSNRLLLGGTAAPPSIHDKEPVMSRAGGVLFNQRVPSG